MSRAQTPPHPDTAAAARFAEQLSLDAAWLVMRRHSTSFTAANLLLPRRTARRVAAVYALARLADEIVDGAAAGAGLAHPAVQAHLDALEAATRQAISERYATNPIVHAFALTAAAYRFDPEWIEAFFRSMRDDARPPSTLGLDEYVYGSAEVIGLMCVHCFFAGPPPAHRARIYAAARALGVAFQLLNFLRDAREDEQLRGRDYLGLRGPDRETRKRAVELDIEQQLRQARSGVPLLPRTARAGVTAAIGLFEQLHRRLRAVDADRLRSGPRVRVPDAVKLLILLRALPYRIGAGASTRARTSGAAA